MKIIWINAIIEIILINFEFWIQILFVAGFTFAYFIEHIPLSLRITGLNVGDFPLGTLRSSQIMILNRLGASIFFVSAGLLVDLGASPKQFLALFSITWALLGFLSLIYIRNWRATSKFIIYYIFDNKKAESDSTVIKFNLKDVLMNYPFLLHLFGASVPVILASFFSDYRGSLLQIGFVFNSIATILVVFVIEPKFIGYISNDENGLADIYHQRLIFSKALLLLSMSCISGVIIFLI